MFDEWSGEVEIYVKNKYFKKLKKHNKHQNTGPDLEFPKKSQQTRPNSNFLRRYINFFI